MDNEYFITEENLGMLKLAKEANTIVVYTLNLSSQLRLSTKILDRLKI